MPKTPSAQKRMQSGVGDAVGLQAVAAPARDPSGNTKEEAPRAQAKDGGWVVDQKGSG